MKNLPPGACPDTQAREKRTPCRRRCCWTPLGHSTVRDHIAPADPRACRCHGEDNR